MPVFGMGCVIINSQALYEYVPLLLVPECFLGVYMHTRVPPQSKKSKDPFQPRESHTLNCRSTSTVLDASQHVEVLSPKCAKY